MQIYLDNAATTPVDKCVTKAMFEWQENNFGNPSSPHRHGQASKIKLEEVRDDVARTLGCLSKEVVFTSGGTESNNKAIIGACLANRAKGNHLIISAVEHPSVLAAADYLKKIGFEISYLKPDKTGSISLDDLEAKVQPNTILLSMMYVNNETGVIFPIEKTGKFCKEKNIIFHCDAVQAFGKMNIDVNKLKVDLLSFSAHKIYGPKGVGGLFVRDGIALDPLSFGGGQEANKRAGTENLVGIIGLHKALELMQNRHEEWQNISDLSDKLERKLSERIPSCVINAKGVERSPYISNISFPGLDNQSLLLKMDLAGLSASVGSACSSGSIKQSHVLQAMGLKENIINSAIRFSLGRFTRAEDIDAAIEIITSQTDF
jgi:cysteine desulfurase